MTIGQNRARSQGRVAMFKEMEKEGTLGKWAKERLQDGILNGEGFPSGILEGLFENLAGGTVASVVSTQPEERIVWTTASPGFGELRHQKQPAERYAMTEGKQQKIEFPKGTYGSTKELISTVVWYLQEQGGELTDDANATGILREALADVGVEVSAGNFSTKLKEMEGDWKLIDREVHGRRTKRITLTGNWIPPLPNPYARASKEEPKKAEEPAREEKGEEDKARLTHYIRFEQAPVSQKRAHLHEKHGKPEFETTGQSGPELQALHRACHDIEDAEARIKALPKQKKISEKQEPAVPIEEYEPKAVEAPDIGSKLLAIMNLAGEVLVDAASLEHVEEISSRIEDLEVKLKAEGERAEKWRRQYGRMKAERDRLWAISKRLEANIEAIVRGKPVDDRELKDLQRQMRSIPGHDNGNGSGPSVGSKADAQGNRVVYSTESK